MKKIIALTIAISIAAFLFTGCSCAAEKITEKIIEQAAASEGEDIDVDISEGEIKIQGQDGEEMNISADEGGATIKTDEGETVISTGEGLDLPEDFPAEVPVPSDLNIITGSSFTQDGEKTFSIAGTYTGSLEELSGWYKNELSGWEVEYEETFEAEDGSTYSITAVSSSNRVSVLIFESEGEVTLTLQVEGL